MITEYTELGEKDWNRIRKSLAESRGKTLVLVHPFYATGSKTEMKKLKGVRGRDVLDYLFELQKTLKRWKGPVFMMVEADKIPVIKELLKHGKRDIVIIPTCPETPTPTGDGGEWKAFLEKLKKEGLKEVVMGGELYYKAKAGEAGCVSGAKRLWSKEVTFEYVGTMADPGTGKKRRVWVPADEIGRTGISVRVLEKLTFPGRLRKRKRK